MSVSNYINSKCKYTYSKLKNVIYLVSKEHVKNVYVDNGEAYIDHLSQLPLRLNGFSINLNEESSLDERYEFQKTVTLSMHGYVSHKLFEGKYYVILESEDGTYWMANVDFPSRVTYTFNLSKDTYQTDFTFASLSNFPTLRLNADFEAVEPPCLGYNVYGIQSLKLIEKQNATLDTNNKTVYTYGNSFKDIEFLGDSCSYSSVFDGNNVVDTITFNIAFDAYKSSWHYNLLEFVNNLYSAIIEPKSSTNTFYSGFNYGLQPNFTVQTSDTNDGSDIITITLREMSSNGLTAAKDWKEEQSTQTRWVNVKQIGNTICWECVSRGKARYLVQREVMNNGTSTGNYRVLEGYESQYADIINVTETFNSEQLFDEPSCSGEQCNLNTNIPNRIVFTSTTCNRYTFETSCQPTVDNNIPDITVEVLRKAGGGYSSIRVCNNSSTTRSGTFTITYGGNQMVVRVDVIPSSSFVNPPISDINCLAQNVAFTFDSNCPITVTNINSALTYTITNTQLIVNVPRNYSTTIRSFTINVSNCSGKTQTVLINQDKTYETWVTTQGYICDGTTSYQRTQRYTGTTSLSINVPTDEYGKGDVIQVDDPNCQTVSTRWITSQYFICIDGNKWSFEEEEISYDNEVWTKSGQIRPLQLVESGSSFCSDSSIETDWRITDRWQCESS